jgi:uncharacterized MnhB-related membrane protein
MSLLIVAALLLTVLTGTGVVLARTPQRQIFAMGANGLVLSLLFMALQAPDVAFAELIIGAAALPLMFFVVLASTKMQRRAPGRKP